MASWEQNLEFGPFRSQFILVTNSPKTKLKQNNFDLYALPLQ